MGVAFSLPQALPKGISALKSLKVLDLEGNKLEYLATEISNVSCVIETTADPTPIS